MARVTKIVCDRCGKKLEYIGWTALIRTPKKIKVRKLLNGNHSGYSYSDWDYELCNKCTRALESFILCGERRDKE